MNTCSITEKDNALEIELAQEPSNMFVLAALGFMTLLSAMVPLVMLLFAGIGTATLASGLLFVLSAYFFLRLFLWNWKGKEVIRFSAGTVHQVIDYGWFRSEDSIKAAGLSVRIYDEDGSPSDKSEYVLDDGMTQQIQQGYIRLMQKGDVVLSLRTKLAQPTLDELVDTLENWLATNQT